uniref:heme attachment to plastid cytochrome c n=1 Tax=Hydrocytium acuminatum TaxID=1745963 RepID=UPI002A800B85|nr:heme attachment to plastid cytochrome c [Hydrocytium acuminatum]WOR09518.1 heme attachment to plastid cytochrome c [Hydrocytium acuminatum]
MFSLTLPTHFESFLTNLSFVSLLITMVLNWLQVVQLLPRKWDLPFLGILFSNLILLAFLILRWFDSGHFPISNLYESFMFLSWSFTTIYLILKDSDFYNSIFNLKFNNLNINTFFDRSRSNQIIFNEFKTMDKAKNDILDEKSFSEINKQSNTFRSSIIGTTLSSIALLTNAFATFRLPLELREVSPLVPALQSNWLVMHVTIMILSYAALMSGSLLAICFLIITYFQTRFYNPKYTNMTENSSRNLDSSFSYNSKLEENQSSNLNFSSITTLNWNEINWINIKKNETREKTYGNQLQKLSRVLDDLSYRILGIGFPLLTIGILSGAVWANEAWGSYWSWDPKETWAFLTWLVFAVYLHTRLTKGWQGKTPAIIASVGFIVVWICFLGVNLLGKGLHSYGWFQ